MIPQIRPICQMPAQIGRMTSCPLACLVHSETRQGTVGRGRMVLRLSQMNAAQMLSLLLLHSSH